MFKDIEINNFRGLRYLKINNLGKVNLFFGNNNCGKSSVLEALFILTGMSNPRLNINVNLFREYGKVDKKDLQLLFYGFFNDCPISIKSLSENETRHLEISLFEDTSSEIQLNRTSDIDAMSNKPEEKYGLKNSFTVIQNGHSDSYEYKLDLQSIDAATKKIDIRNAGKVYSETIHSKFLAPKHQFQVSVEKLQELKERKQIQPIVDVLRKIEPKIQDLDYIDKEVFVDLGYPSLVPINIMGDGLRKLLSVLVSIYECQNGAIFIDEIDNGFHYSKMPLLWQTVLAAAETYNVQIFASTHNIDSIKGLSTILQDVSLEKPNETVNGFYLQHLPNDEVKSYRYEAEKLQFLINNGEELR